MIRLIKLNKYKDSRGYLCPVWREDKDQWDSLPTFCEDRLSVSEKGVLRGLHGDFTTGKLFIPVRGCFQFFAQQLNGNNRLITKIDSKDPHAIYVPPGWINGHLCLGEGENILLYKWTKYYNGPENQVTIAWDDKTLNVPWGIKNPILSDRDKNACSYDEIIDKFTNKGL